MYQSSQKAGATDQNALRAPRLPHVRTAFSHSKFQGWHGCAHYRNRFTRVQLPGKQCSCIGMGEHVRVGETVVHSTLDSNQHWLNVGLFFFFFFFFFTPRTLSRCFHAAYNEYKHLNYSSIVYSSARNLHRKGFVIFYKATSLQRPAKAYKQPWMICSSDGIHPRSVSPLAWARVAVCAQQALWRSLLWSCTFFPLNPAVATKRTKPSISHSAPSPCPTPPGQEWMYNMLTALGYTLYFKCC